MAWGQAESGMKQNGRQSQILKDQITKKQAIRKSARLQVAKLLRNSKRKHIREVQATPSSPSSSSPDGKERPQTLHKSPKLHQKRKREQDAGHTSPEDRDQPHSKRPRTSPTSLIPERALKTETANDSSKETADLLKYWIQTKRWPKEYFEPDVQVKEDLDYDSYDSWLEEQMERSYPVVQYVEINGIKYPRPIRKIPTSLRRKQSDSSLTGSNDQKGREAKSAPYRSARYTTLLAAKGSYMEKSDSGIMDSSRTWCNTLLSTQQTVARDSLFRDDIFEKTCQKLQERNEARVIQDIGRLIVPSAETLATYGAKYLDHLIENVNEGWTEAIPVEGPRPQPDYSVGFRRTAFSAKQLKKLDPFIGSIFDTSFFVATYQMYFPFLTCEVKCGAAALDVADRQNAHSMTLAVRGVVELFRLVKREKELHREILAFSVSHDHRSVRIYGHYAEINGHETKFYRHPIHDFSFTALDGKEKWTAYKFTKNVYDMWMPEHLRRICSAIEKIPEGINFDVSQSSELEFSESTGLSQQIGASILGETESQLDELQKVTPDTSVSKATEKPPKRPKKRATAG